MKEYKHSTDPNPTGGQWQIVLKLAGAKRRGFTGSAYAYEARNRQGEVVFWGEAVLQALLLGQYMKLWWKPLSRRGPLVFSKFWYSATAGN